MCHSRVTQPQTAPHPSFQPPAFPEGCPMVSRNQSSPAEAGVHVLGSQDQLPGIIMPLIPFERMEVSPIPQGFRARAGEAPTLGLCTHRCSGAPALQSRHGVTPPLPLGMPCRTARSDSHQENPGLPSFAPTFPMEIGNNTM